MAGEGEPQPTEEKTIKKAVKESLKGGFHDFTGWGKNIPRRGFLEPFWNITRDLPLWFDKVFKPEPGTDEYARARTLSRREFLKLVPGLGKWALGVYLGVKFGPGILEKLLKPLEPETQGRPKRLGQLEVEWVYILGGREQAKDIAKVVALHARGVNKETWQPIDLDKHETWGESSLTDYVDALVNLQDDLLTTEGRRDLLKKIDLYAERNRETYQLYISGENKIIDYAAREAPSTGALDYDQLLPYLRDNLGYGAEERKVFDAVILFKTDSNSFWEKYPEGLKAIINNYNKVYNPDLIIP